MFALGVILRFKLTNVKLKIIFDLTLKPKIKKWHDLECNYDNHIKYLLFLVNPRKYSR